MRTVIEKVTIASVEEGRFYLKNSAVARVISIGTSWNILRIGFRLAMDDGGINIFGTPRFWVGVMSAPAVGLTNGPLGNTSHFFGHVTIANTWTRSLSPTRYSVGATGVARQAKRIVNTLTTEGSFSNTVFSADPTVRTIYITEIRKGSPNFTADFIHPTAITVDRSMADMVSAINIANFASIPAALNAGGGTWAQGGVSTGVSIDEATNGFFDSITLGWDRGAPGLHVSELCWRKMS